MSADDNDTTTTPEVVSCILDEDKPRSLKALADKTHNDDRDNDDGWRRSCTPSDAIADETLAAALPPAILRRIMRGDPVAVVVAVPGADWIGPVADAVGTLNQRADVIKRDGTSRREHRPTEGNDTVAAMLRRGRPVVGVSQAPTSFLPATLLAIADASVAIRPPDGAALRRVLARCGCRPLPRDIPPTPCVGLSFDDICSAFRRDATGRDVLAMLARISGRKAGADTDDGVPPLQDLPGYSGEPRAWATALVGLFSAWRENRRPWRDVSTHASAVLSGPPGTGKSMLIRSLAKALGIPLFSTSVGDWFARTDGNLGDVARAFQEFWDRAMAARPCLVAIEELDGIPDRATLTARGREWWTPVVTQILLATDASLNPRDGMVLCAASNHATRLDAALVRRGRFDRIVEVGLPTSDDLAAILAYHLDGVLAPADLRPVARLARGATAADAMGWAREARSRAGAAGRAVSVADVSAIVAPADARSPDTLRRCAIHEAGHAVASLRMGRGVECVTMVAKGTSHARTTIAGGADIPTLADVDADLVVTLAGRAAEEVMLESVSAGAERDLADATATVAAAHASAGLGASLVHRAASPDAIALLNVDSDLRHLVGAHLADVYGLAVALVEANRDAVARVADALIDRRFLSGDDVRALAGDGATGGAS